GGFEITLELWPGAPGHPPVSWRLKHRFDEPEVIGELVQGCVGAIRRPQQWQSVAIRHEPAARRAKGDIAGARQADAQSLPVQAAVQQPEIARVYVPKDDVMLEGGQVDWPPLDVG